MTRARSRARGVAIDGLLLLDKPEGISSNRALQHAKRLLNARKAGHTGSLDPIATGLLPLCFGEATKISELLLHADKSYWTRIQLGVATDTGDRDGCVLRESKVQVSAAQLDDALARFRGALQQTPPMHSALKRNGRPLYELARAGISVERAPRAVTVHELSLRNRRGDLIDLHLRCSRGFYVRALASDLGDALGCGAHVRALRRTAVGGFSLDDACTLQQIEAIEPAAARQRLLRPADAGLSHLPAVHLPPAIAARLRHGQAVPAAVAAGEDADAARSECLLRVYAAAEDGHQQFLGLARRGADGMITPKRLFYA